MGEGQRTYTEEEFAEVLRKAAELSKQSEVSEISEGRITLDEMRAIASEVGLDPDLVERAARLLPARRSETNLPSSGESGGGSQLVAWFPTPMTKDRSDRVLSAIRAATRQQGGGEGTSSGLVWSGATAVATIHSEATGSRVQVTANRRLALVWSVALGLFTGMLSFINSDETVGAAITSLIVGLAVAVAVGTIVELVTRKRLRELMRAIRHAFEEMGGGLDRLPQVSAEEQGEREPNSE